MFLDAQFKMSVGCFYYVGFDCRSNWSMMDQDNILHENKIIPKVGEDDYFDQNRFLSVQGAQRYDKYLGRTIIREREVCLDKVEEKRLAFLGQL